jgi:hypothetical protein
MSGQQHAPAVLYPHERPGTHCAGGWVAPRAGLAYYNIESLKTYKITIFHSFVMFESLLLVDGWSIMGIVVSFQIMQLFMSCRVRHHRFTFSYLLISFYYRRHFPHSEFSCSSSQNFYLKQNIVKGFHSISFLILGGEEERLQMH